jgi:amidohydrolase
MDLSRRKGLVREAVEENRDRLEGIARYLYENPELGSEEEKAAERLTEELEKADFIVEREIAGISTAFKATYNSDERGARVAVIAEYDALPGVGHGCGHNLIAASAIGAGIAASMAMEGLKGEIMVVGTPAEEGHGRYAGSKAILVEKGFWDDIDAAIMLHPSTSWGVGNQSLGIWFIKMEFKGQTSHAAVDPHRGVNALNAATLAYMAIHMLRQEAKRDANLVIHGIISEGGSASNIIPDRAVCDFGVRSSQEDYLEQMVDKVENCAQGAALATGTQVKVNKKKLYSSKKLNIPLIRVLWKNYDELGLPLQDWKESIRGMPLASTDFGDVSQRIPVAGSYIKIAPEGTPGHSIQMADASVSEEGIEAMITGTKALANTIIELLSDQEILEEAKEYFQEN